MLAAGGMDQGHGADRMRPAQLEDRGFGVLLRDYRLAAGLTQDALAEQAGLSVRGIADLERGARRFPHAATIERLSDALGLTAAERTALELASRRPSPRTDVWPVANQIGVSSSDQARLAEDALRVDREAVARPGAQSTLTLPPTSFVGRQREVAELQQLLPTTRLLSIVGPGGIGKTRLALEAARLSASTYADGAFVVDLAPLSQAELVIPTTAQVIGLRVELDRQPLQHLVAFMAPRHLMLVIDNCEHVIDSCAELAQALMEQCPDVRLLTTGREPLGVDGETVWRLEPLENAAATQLFVERARAQRADFDSADLATIERLCQALDNLPLALELAAARVTLLTPGEILARLHERFELLKRVGSRGFTWRQQTLRATVEWSYALLEPTEHQLFRRLSVFAGSFDLAGANAMGGADTLDVLGRLVDKSLVIAQATEHRTRYRLLETLRSYAWERLRDAGEVEFARRRHLDHFLGRAESLYRPTETIDGPTRVLDDDLDNLRSAMEWCQMSDPRAGLQLIGATRTVWFRRDFAEGRRWARLFLERCTEPSVARVHALLTAGELEALADTERSKQLLVEARDVAANLGDRETYVMADWLLGTVAFLEGRTPDAVHLEQSLTVSEELGDARMSGCVRVVLAWALLTNRVRREEARVALERAQRLGAEVGDRWIVGMVDYSFGLYWRWTGHPQHALDHFRHAATALHAIGDVANLCVALFQIARLLAGRDPVRAARLAGGALAIGAHVGVRPGHRLGQAIDQLEAELGARIGIQQAHAAWLQGEQLSADEAVSLALEDEEGMSKRHGGLSA
jgi:predicted ATPase/transcriptional regulator with XRE-family HTH domain